MKDPRPAYQWYPKEFLSSSRVARMTLEAEGAYRRLLDYQWMDGSLPDDMDELASLCRVTTSKMRILWRAVGCCFDALDGYPGRLVNPRLEAVRRDMTEFIESKRKAGQAGAAKTNLARWGVGSESAGGQQTVGTAVGKPSAEGRPATATATANGPSLRSGLAPPAGDAPPKRSKKSDDAVLRLPDGRAASTAFAAGWNALFRLHKGTDYGFDGGKDGTAARAILALAGLRRKPEPSPPEEAERVVQAALQRAEALLTSTDPFFVGKGVDLALLRSQWNRVGSAGVGTAPQRDIRRGFAEAAPSEAFAGGEVAL